MKQNVIKNNVFWMLWLSILALLSSYGFEYFLNLNPCPLCVMQRFCTIVLVFLCLCDFIFSSRVGRCRLMVLQFLMIALGLMSAGRQLWLQIYANHDSSLCMPGFEELVQFFSWDVILKMLFWGSNDCASVSWTLMGMPISVWSMGYFFLMLGLFITQVFRKKICIRNC